MKVSGDKATLIERLKECDISFIARRYRKLNQLDTELVDAAIRTGPLIDPEAVLKEFADGNLTRKMLFPFGSTQSLPIPAPAFDFCLSMIAEREKDICVAYLESQRQERPGQIAVAKLSFFALLERDDFLNAATSVPNLMAAKDTEGMLIIPVLREGVYSLVLVNFSGKTVMFFDPRLNSSLPFIVSELPANCFAKDMIFRECVTNFLRHLGCCGAEESWCPEVIRSLYPQYTEGVEYFEPIEASNAHDSAIFALTAIDFISNDVPLIFFRRHLGRLRALLVHQLLCGRFPR